MYKDKQQARKGVSNKLKKKKVPKGYHRMPDGSLMKGNRHPSSKKKY